MYVSSQFNRQQQSIISQLCIPHTNTYTEMVYTSDTLQDRELEIHLDSIVQKRVVVADLAIQWNRQREKIANATNETETRYNGMYIEQLDREIEPLRHNVSITQTEDLDERSKVGSMYMYIHVYCTCTVHIILCVRTCIYMYITCNVYILRKMTYIITVLCTWACAILCIILYKSFCIIWVQGSM